MIKNRNRIIPAALVLIGIVLVLVLGLTGKNKSAGTYDELIVNGGAEEGDRGWITSAYLDNALYTEFSVREGEGMDGSAAFYIKNLGPNDARYAQTVSVSPDTLYLLSAHIRADCSETDSADGKTPRGANISVEGIYVFSESVFRSEDWQEVRLYGRTGPEQTSLTVYVRLGGYSGETVGEAWFDSVSVRRVDEAESGFVIHDLYTVSHASEGEDETAPAGSAAGLLILTAVLFLGAVILLSRRMMGESGAADNKKRTGIILGALLAAGLILRIAVAVSVTGYDVDVGDFRIWADRIYSVGPGAFYGSTWCDYPPGYLLVLWVLGFLGHFSGGTSVLLVKMPSIVCDLAAAALLFRTARKKGLSPDSALMLTALYVFNPMTVVCGAAWGQGDSVMTLLLMITVLLGISGTWEAALPVYGLAVMMKPQSLMFGPVGLAALAGAFIPVMKDRDALRILLKRVLTGLGIMCGGMLLILLPFIIGQGGISWLFELYGNTMGSYGYVTVNGCNWHFLFGLNWVGVDETAGLLPVLVCLLTVLLPPALTSLLSKGRGRERIAVPAAAGLVLAAGAVLTLAGALTWRALGTAVILFGIALTAWMYLRGRSPSHLPLCGAALLCLLFASGTMMHERYLFPAAILLLLAYLEERDRRVLWVFGLVTAACFLNAGCVLDRNIRIGGPAGHLTAPAFGLVSDMTAAEMLSAVLTVLSAVSASLLMCVKCVPGLSPIPWPEAAEAPAGQEKRASFAENAARRLRGGDALRRPDRKDALIISAVSLIYCAFALFDLGSTKAPQTFRAMEPGEQAVFDLGSEKSFDVLVYQGIQYNDIPYILETSSDGTEYVPASETTATVGDCFKWRYVMPSSRETYSARYLRITSLAAPADYEIREDFLLTLYEVILRDEAGNVLPVTVSAGAESLADEQDTLTGEPDWFNSAYFDEIYHARTGYEILHGLRIYEWTHPPLGKVLMSLCIGIFGMTPFGWRFAGTMMGVFMLPAMYLTGRLLFKKRLGGIGAMGLMLLDFMHFTQTRIATIDSFVVCFILWSFYFMLRWFLLDLWGRPLTHSLADLGLSGLFIGLAIASKWTGCYAAVGLAVIFFWGLGRRILEIRAARTAAEVGTDTAEQAPSPEPVPAAAAAASGQGPRMLVVTVACCFVFFLFVPLLIYYLAYIPFLAANGSLTGSLGENIRLIVVQCEGMLSYHSTPGLGMDHYFYSPWYEWPIIKKPMWYSSTAFAPEGMGRTIISFGNPAVWWVGGAAMIAVFVLLLFRLLSKAGLLSAPANAKGEEAPLPEEGEPEEAASGKNERAGSEKTGAGRILSACFLRLRSLRLPVPPADDPVPALIALSFLAQYLPWVLVSRGTYIYHYFPSVPFIILAAVLFVCRLEDRRPGAGRIVLGVLLALALALFIAFFPYISGISAPREWLDSMKWFGNWLFY